MTFYPTAAAAQEAGFRPCLRCRPETSPDLGAWRGTSNTVSRALALIEPGALDEGDVDALAGRLGVGERQLRRLFRQHLGASPIAVAQTRRVLLAKQLIHETRLPMAEIALPPGFGSIRRFNETFQALYGRPPGDAAARAAAPEAGRAGGRDQPAPALSAALRLAGACSEFLRARAIPGVERVDGERYCAHHRSSTARQGIVSVRPAGGERAARDDPLPEAVARCPAIIARLRRVFDLAADPLAIAAHLAKDPALAPLVAARPGLRVPGAWDGFELAVRAVLGQQITVAAAVRLAGRWSPRIRRAPGASRDRRADPRLPAAARAWRARTWPPSACRGAGRPRCPPWRPRSSPIRMLFGAQPRARRGHPRGCDHPRRRRMDGAVHRPARAARAGRLSRRRHRARCALADGKAGGGRHGSSLPGPRRGGRGAPTPRSTSGPL